ncbi:MAG: site-specific integrase [Deltaproteobacteria bacterium]|nr:site-specific integrase [Deltaproteobacteria bacterium]
MAKLKKYQSEFNGVRFYKHPTRKHGVKFDRYFSIRYQYKGKRNEEGLGWESEGWTAKKAALKLATIKEAQRTGEGPITLSEAREKRDAADAQKKAEGITFGEIYENRYRPQAETEKTRETLTREKSLYLKWLKPVLSALPLRSIAPIHLEKIKAQIRNAGLSPRSQEYALALVRQVFSYAKRHGLFRGDNPVSRVKIPRNDNARLRFLTPGEAAALLEKLQGTDRTAYEMALLSLHMGLRASEIFKLRWGDINVDLGTVTIKDSKSGSTGIAYMTEAVKSTLIEKDIGAPDDLIFPKPITGGIRREVPRAFKEAVDALGLNDGKTDPRDRVVFHSLRHTYASWLIQGGESIYTVKDRLRHKTLVMATRYAHLAAENQKRTAGIIEDFSRPKNAKESKAEAKNAG